ncbi:MAG: hypothetical protein ACK4V4_05565 [Sphingobacteriales bacterium]|jgi:hypothetical protein
MKHVLIFVVLLVLGNAAFSQPIISYKTKTSANATDRTKILDLVRAEQYKYVQQELIFVVKKLNLFGGYAWFEGEAQRKDGRKIIVDEYSDCCHVEALLKKNGGKWYIVKSSSFSTDVWWYGLWDDYRLPRDMFFIN